MILQLVQTRVKLPHCLKSNPTYLHACKGMLSTLKEKQEIQCENTWECMDFVYICIVICGCESG